MEGDVRRSNGNVDKIVRVEAGEIAGCHSDMTPLAGEGGLIEDRVCY